MGILSGLKSMGIDLKSDDLGNALNKLFSASSDLLSGTSSLMDSISEVEPSPRIGGCHCKRPHPRIGKSFPFFEI